MRYFGSDVASAGRALAGKAITVVEFKEREAHAARMRSSFNGQVLQGTTFGFGTIPASSNNATITYTSTTNPSTGQRWTADQLGCGHSQSNRISFGINIDQNNTLFNRLVVHAARLVVNVQTDI